MGQTNIRSSGAISILNLGAAIQDGCKKYHQSVGGCKIEKVHKEAKNWHLN
jgi:hypothetical protein